MGKRVEVDIKGMHCASCEVLVERKFKQVKGVEEVNVNHASGRAELYCRFDPDINELNDAIKEHGYSVSSVEENKKTNKEGNVYEIKKDHIEIGAIFLIVIALYFILKQFKILPDIGISNNVTYGVAFLIGLVAAFSTCIAVTGGLLVAATNKYVQLHPNLTGYQKFKPHIYFNIGRIVSYTILGGLLGIIGSKLAFSARTTGILTIVVSIVMIMLGFQLLNIFPWLRHLSLKMPKSLAHKIFDASNEKTNKKAPFLFGASTFFLPCGFTQALQLYVLSTGSFITGALTMGFFSLGTLPALVSLGAISSLAKGKFYKYFVKTSAVIVVLLGIFSFTNGLTLTGYALPSFTNSDNTQAIPTANILDGKQIIELKVDGLDYYPKQFTVIQGVPVEWRIDGRNAQGCAQVISVPNLGITEYLPRDQIKTVTFTPQNTGTIRFSCTMGMAGPGVFNVVPNTQGIVPVQAADVPANKLSNNAALPTNGEVQKLDLEISRERGFYPKSFTVKKGIPVELDIDAKVQLGGCMSVLVIPQYNVAHRLTLGQSKLTFTPTETGTQWATCSMGARMVQFNVV